MVNTLFPIVIDVEDSALGAVLRLLNKTPGVAKFHLDLDSVPKKITNGTKPPRNFTRKKPDGGISVKDMIIGFLFENGPQSGAAIRLVIVEAGRSATNSPTVLRSLVEKGIVETDSDGKYKLTLEAETKLRQHAGQTALPAPDQPAKPKKVQKTRRFQKSGQEILLGRLSTAEAPLSRIELREVLVANGFKPVSIDGSLYKLKSTNMVKTVATGMFEITAKGRKHYEKMIQPKEK